MIWRNEVEGGFDQSPFSTPGEVALWQCSQFSLAESLQRTLDIFDNGYDVGPWTSGPRTGEWSGGKT